MVAAGISTLGIFTLRQLETVDQKYHTLNYNHRPSCRRHYLKSHMSRKGTIRYIRRFDMFRYVDTLLLLK